MYWCSCEGSGHQRQLILLPTRARPWCVMSPSVCQTQWAAAWPSQWCPWPRPTRSTPTSALTPCPPCQGPTWPGPKASPGGRRRRRGETTWRARGRRTTTPPWERAEDRRSRKGWGWRRRVQQHHVVQQKRVVSSRLCFFTQEFSREPKEQNYSVAVEEQDSEVNIVRRRFIDVSFMCCFYKPFNLMLSSRETMWQKRTAPHPLMGKVTMVTIPHPLPPPWPLTPCCICCTRAMWKRNTPSHTNYTWLTEWSAKSVAAVTESFWIMAE